MIQITESVTTAAWEAVSLRQHTAWSMTKWLCNNCDHSCKEAVSLQEQDETLEMRYQMWGQQIAGATQYQH